MLVGRTQRRDRGVSSPLQTIPWPANRGMMASSVCGSAANLAWVLRDPIRLANAPALLVTSMTGSAKGSQWLI